MERIVIDEIRPSTPTARYPAKAVVGEAVPVTAAIFRDGHDLLSARVRWRKAGARRWQTKPMVSRGNDAWEGRITPDEVGPHEFYLEAWTDYYRTWLHAVEAKHEAEQDIEVELEEVARFFERLVQELPKKVQDRIAATAVALRDVKLDQEKRLARAVEPWVAKALEGTPDQADLTRSSTMQLWVDRPLALVGAWYEMFPRSEGGLAPGVKRLSEIAEMGFDIVYLPPIHPIGKSFRKGKNNTLNATPEDPGSPWAIGSDDGGHTAIDRDLGTFEDFDRFVAAAGELGMEVALDYALQCSPDHPWVREHPEWFHHRPDGSIKYAENPPKKYQDIYPINFWPETGRQELWEECRKILEFWIARGVKVFRVDNPHTKPLAFWQWLIPAVQSAEPETIFLAEAFTTPRMMSKLAEVGFTQSYTYFTWRTSRWEFTEYLTELALGPKADYMRPNFWPNTPDILSGPLRHGTRGAFKQRLVLAATMSPSYGIYSGYELMENEPASESNEEYLNSEKYEIKKRNWERPGSLSQYIARINDSRRRHPALRELRNIVFHETNDANIIAYSKATADLSDVVLVVVNLDPVNAHDTRVWLDLSALGFLPNQPFEAHDELTGATYPWGGPNPYVRLDPAVEPAHLFHLRLP